MDYKFLLGTFTLFLAPTAYAGTFIPNGTESYNTEDIHKIVFDGDKVITVWENGQTNEYEFSSLQRIYFSEPGSQTEAETQLAEDNVELYLYPNPVVETLTLKGLPATAQVCLLSADGKIVRDLECEGGMLQANVSDLPKGIYFLRANGKAVKFVKQ